jgi:CspA family cold shock protein
MAKGTIKRLVAERGFGFINTGEEKDLFFHRNDLQGVAYESLMEGQEVEFEVEPTEQGLRAKNVRLAGGSS